MAALSGEEKLAELTTKKSGTVLMIHFEKEIDQFSIKYGKDEESGRFS